MVPSALIFDMDGVIVDSTATHVEAWRRYLRECGVDAPNLEQQMLGKHNSALVREFFGHEDLSETAIAAHGARKESIYRQIMAPMLAKHLVPGLLVFLEQNQSMKLAVATNAEAANLDFVLDVGGLRRFFRVTVHGDEIARPKPAPDIYLEAARRLRVDPTQCLVFEDSLPGVEAARSAGMRVAGVTTTVSHFEGVEFQIDDFCDPALERCMLLAV